MTVNDVDLVMQPTAQQVGFITQPSGSRKRTTFQHFNNNDLVDVVAPHNSDAGQAALSGHHPWSLMLPMVVLLSEHGEYLCLSTLPEHKQELYTTIMMMVVVIIVGVMMTGMVIQIIVGVRNATSRLLGEKQEGSRQHCRSGARYCWHSLCIMDAKCKEGSAPSTCSEGRQDQGESWKMAWICRVVMPQRLSQYQVSKTISLFAILLLYPSSELSKNDSY